MKKYNITFKNNGVYQSVLVNADTNADAKLYFKDHKPNAEILNCTLARAEDVKPSKSELTVPLEFSTSRLCTILLSLTTTHAYNVIQRMLVYIEDGCQNARGTLYGYLLCLQYDGKITNEESSRILSYSEVESDDKADKCQALNELYKFIQADFRVEQTLKSLEPFYAYNVAMCITSVLKGEDLNGDFLKSRLATLIAEKELSEHDKEEILDYCNVSGEGAEARYNCIELFCQHELKAKI